MEFNVKFEFDKVEVIQQKAFCRSTGILNKTNYQIIVG